MKRIILITLVLISALQVANAQKIKFKKGVVTADGKPILNYENSILTKEFTTLDDAQTIILKFIHDSEYTNGETYCKVIFVEQNKSFTSRSYIFTKKILVKKLLKSKLIDANGNFNSSKIDKFIMKYDEKVEDQKKEVHIIIR